MAWFDILSSQRKGLILLKMMLDICSYNEEVSKVIGTQDFQSPIDYLFFLLALLQQQKRINRLNIEKKKQVTLLDFTYE